MEFDVAKGAQYDLGRRCVQALLLEWARDDLIEGMWVAFPCTTFSCARKPALRTMAFLKGLPAQLAKSKEARQIKAGERTLSTALWLAALTIRFSIAAIFENPHSSLAWHDPRWARIRRHDSTSERVLDYCRFGCTYRKRTRFMCVNISHACQLDRRCRGRRGVCENGKPHQHLAGKFTSAAQQYPTSLASLMVRLMRASIDRQVFEFLQLSS